MMLWNHYAAKQSKKEDKEMGATKGVGGYRPTINWREVTIKRRSVADRQVLACIVLSGLLIITIGTIITILGFLVISSQCPFMWVETEGVCYYMAQHNTTYSRGWAYCRSQSANLLRLRAAQQATFIIDRMVGRSWLGLRQQEGGSSNGWGRWDNEGAAVNYTRWPGGTAPTTTEEAPQCALMETTGDWTIQSCEDVAYVICDYTPSYNPFMLVGPVVVVCGVVVLILSVEVCVRRREFMERNPEVALNDPEDDDRQADAGVVNYGYGNFGSGSVVAPDETQPPAKTTPAIPRKKHSWATVTPSKVPESPGTTQPRPSTSQSKPTISKQPTEEVVSPSEDGPRVEVVAASPTLSVPPVVEENTQSQEQLELLLSPKTLEQ